MQGNSYSLMIHGGAGVLRDIDQPSRAKHYHDSLRGILVAGGKQLAAGVCALDVVEMCVVMLEDDPLYNAGRGAVLNIDGDIELDAGIADGRNLQAGAVAAVRGIANPVRLARQLLERSPHLLLVGEGALRFADECDFPRVGRDYFLTAERIDQWQRAKASDASILDHDSEQPQGTVGAVARDCFGNLAAATSTGGMVNKVAGRVGDSPIVGAGVYADNRSCAVSATGHGESFMRMVLAKTVADLVELAGKDLLPAAEKAIESMHQRVAGRGGLIAVGADGRCVAPFNTPHMLHGFIAHAGQPVVGW